MECCISTGQWIISHFLLCSNSFFWAWKIKNVLIWIIQYVFWNDENYFKDIFALSQGQLPVAVLSLENKEIIHFKIVYEIFFMKDIGRYFKKILDIQQYAFCPMLNSECNINFLLTKFLRNYFLAIWLCIISLSWSTPGKNFNLSYL